MANSVDSYIQNNVPDQYAPESAMSADEFYQSWMRGLHPDWSDDDIGHYNDFNYKFAKFFGDPSRNRFDSEYQNYLDNLSRKNEYKATMSARAYDEYLSSTQYQRAMKDLQAAGLNPYLLVNNGSVSTGSVTNSAKSSYGSSNTDYLKAQKSGNNAALIFLAIVRLAASLL